MRRSSNVNRADFIEQSALESSLGGRQNLFRFLKQELSWPVDDDDPDPLTYDESDVSGHAAARVQVSRLFPFTAEDPFVIFLAEFSTPFKRGDLREILRGILKQIRALGKYGIRDVEQIVFLCSTEDYNGLRFVHFEEREARQPRMRVFGFGRDSVGQTRTLRELNLPHLRLSIDDDGSPDWKKCRAQWLEAWDVDKVTRTFFDDYARVFDYAKSEITNFPGTEVEKQLYTQRLFNRMLFVHFLSKRGWLTFEVDGVLRTDYLFALWEGRDRSEKFYAAHLRCLFFAGLNDPQSLSFKRDNPAVYSRIGSVPFLNGGLFDQTAEDKNQSIGLPNVIFERIIEDLFRAYNFTVSESTPDDVEVAVDPEMLGKVFEKLITKADKDAKGAFYTPRTVVTFMCEQAIKGYLSSVLPNPEKPDAIERLVDEKDDSAITVREAKVVLLPALDRVRVVDPACGSGAYLLGMMQTIFELTRLLDTRAENAQARDNYERKLSIIQRNLYGVDLEPFAVNIAMLRLWLSLIVDYRDQDVAHLPPLPNLDFKIEVGDSLSAPDPRDNGDIFRTTSLDDAEVLADLKRRHFHATDGIKATLAAQIREKEAVIADDLSKDAAVRLPKDAFDWRVKFIEVFRPRPETVDIGGALNLVGTLAAPPAHGGFHIVIANPPYGGTPVSDAVRYRLFPKSEGPMTNDVYGIFMGRALELLAPGGQFSFIVSNTWRTIKSFKPLRRRLAERTTVLHVLDLPNWIFEATVNTGIVTLTNALPDAGHTMIAGDLTGIQKDDWHTLEANLRLVAAHGVDIQTTTYARYTYPQASIASYETYPFFIASPRLYALMSDTRFTRLSEVAEAKQGLISADDDFYLRQRATARGSLKVINAEEVLAEADITSLSDAEKSLGVDPSLYSGRHFVPYDKGGKSNASDGWLPNYYVPTEYFIDWSISAVSRLRTKTSDRQNGRLAARFQNSSYYFQSGVTFSPTGVYSPTFRLGAGGVFGNKGSTIFSDTLSPEQIMGLAASIIARYIVKNYCSHTVETGEEAVSQLPIPLSDLSRVDQIADLVSKIMLAQKETPEYPYHLREQREIDTLVYQLYGLSDEDIREVTLWYCRRYHTLAAAQGMIAEVHDKYQPYLDRAHAILNKPVSYWRGHPLLTRIAQGEGHRLDLKENLAVDKWGSPERNGGKHVARAVAAFLNTEGGEVIIGADDSGRVVGLDRDMAHVSRHNEDGFALKVREVLSNHLEPAPRGLVDVSFAPLPEGTVCVIRVTLDVGTTYLDNKVYVRDGNRTVELLGRELVEWSAKRRGSAI